MRRHRSLLILLLLLPLLTILALAPPAAAQSDDTLVITVEPLIVAPGGSVTVEVKNFRWSGVARLDVVLRPDAPAEPILLSEGLRLGSRRRAGLSATPPTPGDWEAVADGQWIFGEAIRRRAMSDSGSEMRDNGERISAASAMSRVELSATCSRLNTSRISIESKKPEALSR